MHYIPNTPEQQREMLQRVGVSSVEDLFGDIPEKALLQKSLELPKSLSEPELLCHMEHLASQNENLRDYTCFLGAGAYDHFVPLVIDHLLSREEFFTSYTPYQPEMSQGTLQAIFEYQTMICELTGMEVSNASMYDGATALAEAAVMACSVQKRNKILFPRSVDPQYRKVLATYATNRDIELVELPFEGGQVREETLEAALDDHTAAVLLQSPNFFGVLEKISPLAELAHKKGALCIVSTDLLALGLLEAPGNQGADLVTGNGQSAGNDLLFGGPHFGFFAATQKLMRKMPGRIAGETVDKKGRRGYVLTLQAREQHIRREKATSNICSNHNLNIIAAAIYCSLLGPRGFREMASQCQSKALYTRKKLLETGKFTPLFEAPFFREFALKSREKIEDCNERLREGHIIGGYDLSRNYPELGQAWLVAVTEKRSPEEIARFVNIAAGGDSHES
ncbi:MAG TPA: aminomethyl-transferring glycine dehydrogenase subunit GcvPA [Synergistaceae bacterium]|nr:aminomethyl-transferring glycine dehydrogenase subunit GcvPA [Synergistaceae bacterium]HPJ25901.1 aminomethyl-transferring glycine dehydrogenase subunit GcvPA [Synergistaceae bacterium]HPQ36908.1 aminomethyl-transferring glycine dehydrogenase subunit GcvPA [Synergistaceae bacterium]